VFWLVNLYSLLVRTTRSRWTLILYVWFYNLPCIAFSNVTYLVTWRWPKTEAETCRQLKLKKTTKPSCVVTYLKTIYPFCNILQLDCNLTATDSFSNSVLVESYIQIVAQWNIIVDLFYISLTVLLSLTLTNDQLNAQIFNTFITTLYMYMFRAISRSSSWGQILLTQHLVSSLSVSFCPVHRLRKNWLQFFLHLCSGRSLTESYDTRCCINKIWPPEDEQDIARNMYM
jgi:hypothetical protein